MTGKAVLFAILLFPDQDDLWSSYVVCDEGPTKLMPAARYDMARGRAEDALHGMIRCLTGTVPIETWTVITARSCADALLKDARPQVFEWLRGEPVNRVVLEHEATVTG